MWDLPAQRKGTGLFSLRIWLFLHFLMQKTIRRRSWIEHFSFSQWDKYPIQKLLPCPAHRLSQPGLFWLLTKSHGVIRATSALLCYFTWLHGWQQAGAIKDHLFYEDHPLALRNNEGRELPTPKTQQVGWKHFSMKLTQPCWGPWQYLDYILGL